MARPEDLDRIALTPGGFVLLAGFFGSPLAGARAPLTCLLRVMALGWHLVQIPSGQGGCPSHPDLILQLMFSRATNFPLGEERGERRKRNREQKQRKVGGG